MATLALVGAQAHAVCTFGGSSEPSLQSNFDSLLGPGTLNATTACVDDGDDAAWSTIGSIGEIDIVLELAGNAATNSFGVYDLNDTGARTSIFDGNDATPVPLPTPVVMLMSGLIGLAGVSRRGVI